MGISQFEADFEQSLRYARQVVKAITKDPVEQQDLVQEFSLEVLSRPEKYADIIEYKSTVFNVLKSKYSNDKRKLKAQANEFLPEIEAAPSASAMDHERERIESILYNSIQHSGRKGSVHSFKEQQSILNDYKRRQSKTTTRKFCDEKGISTATLHRLLKKGPIKRETPKTIQWFVMYHLDGKSIDDIAAHSNVSKSTITTQIHRAKKIISKYYQENDFYAQDMVKVPY